MAAGGRYRQMWALQQADERRGVETEAALS
jgi:hypothetical protein